MKNTNVAEDVIKEILKDCNWVERLWVRLNLKLYVRIYRKGVQDGFNWRE